MAKTRNNPSESSNHPTQISTEPINPNPANTPPTAVPPEVTHQLSNIASRLEILDESVGKLASLEAQPCSTTPQHDGAREGL